MSTVGSKNVFLMFSVSTLMVLFPAVGMPAVPVESIGYYQLGQQSDQVTVTGVLGYTADCDLALYRDREAAVMRSGANAVPLPAVNLVVGGGKTSAARLVGLYVIADGKLTRDGAAFVLREPRVTYAFGERGGESPCVAMKSRFVPISALLAAKGDFDKQEIWTIGFARVAPDGGVALFLNSESESSNVWTQRMQVVSRVDSNQIRGCISASGRGYIAILGTVARAAGPGSSRALSRIKSCLPVEKPT